MPWLLTDKGLFAVAGVLVALGASTLVLMLGIAADVSAPAERAKLQIEAIKYGLGSVAAGGAAAALLLALRRQRHEENVHEHTVDDAAERRVTDLYTKAVELLGSTDAAVRLGALYALERVAQNNPRQRQTIVNVLCAYLRMPYALPDDGAFETAAAPMPLNAPSLSSDAAAFADGRGPHQELQVRLTAQRILTTHLRTPSDIDVQQAASLAASPHQPFWPCLDLDLTGATLVDWELVGGNLRNATFTKTTFVGSAQFREVMFAGHAEFSKTTFTDSAKFTNAFFMGAAEFAEANFAREVDFRVATFNENADFGESVFNGNADFTAATFTSFATFIETTFTTIARFVEATFNGPTGFAKATFGEDAWFNNATFNHGPLFDRATFKRKAIFAKATFTEQAQFRDVAYNHIFPPILKNAVVKMGGQKDATWPPGWRLDPGPQLGRLVPADTGGCES
ncbi:hypothetical protein GCM10010166_54210 [Couchioplanes caeruleus subsp. azureus]|uniref:pentapeptide repeat-containing protein n=1 Tax=Couchioplanes caeruleus TaxID=56438 RepID=UPI00166F89C1|nr:hypothetical protein GCM10010166_54210 [Couchioplanes caeruleus subsp. azureus]